MRKENKQQFICLALKAIEEVEVNLKERIDIDVIATKLEKSHWHFQRMFRRMVGVSLGQYLRERRLSEAAHALRHNNLRIIDIACDYQFTSHEAFSRSFKTNFGVTPQEYRENLQLTLPNLRNPIDEEKLQYFWSKIQRSPTIYEREESLLVGSLVEYKSHFLEGSDCKTKVVEHWARFSPMKNLISHRTNQESVGVIISPELDLRNEKLTYLSSVEVSRFQDVPEGLQTMHLPKGLYACFETIGCADTTSSMVDYVYGIWLASTNYKRRAGYDLELFDYRYKQGDPQSVSRFLIPIEC